MGFADYGKRDGIPTFLFHGALGSCYDGLAYAEPAEKLGVRLLCPDRPGRGYSSPHTERTLTGYAKDISDLAKHPNIENYYVFGQSGGGPYTVACAYASPKNELLSATVIAGIGPPEVINGRDAGFYTVTALAVTAPFPRPLTKINDWYFPDSFWASNRKVERMLRCMYNLP